MKYSYKQFKNEYPDDDACLDRILELQYGTNPICPECDNENGFHRIQGRRAYACQNGHHIYPCADTVFEKSRTPLTDWFHAMYLMTATRNGVSAKELERQLGVTYKCAWRIGHQIRLLMSELAKNGKLSGHIEVDETYVGGKRKGARGRGAKGKTIVFGMLEREGNVQGHVVPNVKRKTLRPIIKEQIAQGSTISSDELPTYRVLDQHGYQHGTVNHGRKQYVSGIYYVNGIEGFWSHLKRGIRSTYVSVSGKYLQNYVEEFSYRYNNRKEPAMMFNRLVSRISQHQVKP